MRFDEILNSEINEWERFYWCDIFVDEMSVWKSDFKMLGILNGTHKNDFNIIIFYKIAFSFSG